MRRKILIFVGLMCVVATALAIMSTTQHFRIAKSGLEVASFCAISDTINCDVVSASSYSEFLGVPIAWWGTFYYGMLAIMCFFGAFSRRERRATVTIAWFMALSGIPYVLFLLYVSWAILGVFCLECIGMYCASFVAAIGLYFALKLRLKELPTYIASYIKALFGKPHQLGFEPKIWTHVIIIALVYGIAWLGITVYQTKDNGKVVDIDKQVKAFYSQRALPLKASHTWAVWGNPNAKVKIVEFSEFQCPFCRRASFTVKPFLQEFRKDVALYFVNFPLDNACNPILDRPMHPDACYFAKAAICANKMGNFWDYQEALFINQKGLDRKKALDIAQDKFGWDRAAFQQCVSSDQTEKELKAEIQAALDMKIRGTPSFYLNGRKIRNWVDKKFIQRIVKEEIEKSR